MLKNDKILFVGSLPNRSPNSIGGTTTLFKNLLDYCKKEHFVFSLLTSNYFEFRLFAIPDFLRVFILGLFKLISCKKVMVNVSGKGFYILVPYFIILSKLFNKKVIVRVFGNIVRDYHEPAQGLKRSFITWIIRSADLLLVETKSLVDYLQDYNQNTVWLPNAREPLSISPHEGTFSKKFVFLGQVKTTKGIELVLQVKKRLPDDYTIDIYGPIHDPKYTTLEQESFYKGALKKEEVLPVLQKYDVLLLPTFHEGEGYPGVIIEAYSLGLPCITTNWKSIPEIVEHEQTGLLIQPQSAEALESAILFFNESNYPPMNKAAQQKFNVFNSNTVNANVLQSLSAL